MFFELSSTGFITKQSLIFSLETLIGGLLGAIFGLVGSFGSVMGIVESLTDKFKESQRKKRLNAKVFETRGKILDNFDENDRALVELSTYQEI